MIQQNRAVVAMPCAARVRCRAPGLREVQTFATGSWNLFITFAILRVTTRNFSDIATFVVLAKSTRTARRCSVPP